MAELVGVVLGLAVFSRLHDSEGTSVSAATGHAHALQSIERSLHMDVELSANHWLAEHSGLMQFAVFCYRLYYLPVAVVLLWMLLRHGEMYPRVRRIMIAMAGLALLVFWLMPVSPPRFAVPGIIDIVAERDPVAGAASRDLTSGQNHFSAMPSLHVAWLALCAYATWLAFRSRFPRTALLAWLFPMVMVAVVITTGNHYVLDVVGSAALLSAGITGAAIWERRGTVVVANR